MSSHKVARREKYRVDLSSQMAYCEANYVGLLKLLHNLDACDQWLYKIASHPSNCCLMEIAVKERARYTTILDITGTVAGQGNGLLAPLKIEVRLYHDANMAEVSRWQNHQRIRPRYDYPNDQMHQVNEKLQHNAFLQQWLNQCMRHGLATGDYLGMLPR